MNLNFEKMQGLIPAVVQDMESGEVLMLGYLNEESWNRTLEEKRVTFFSRSKNRLWTKGETSGNYLNLVSYKIDCDQDSVLLLVKPMGPTCHTGTNSCFNYSRGFLGKLEGIQAERLKNQDSQSYTVKLTQRGINKVAQKVGEEAVEVVIEALQNNDQDFLNESADLMYHFLLLLNQKGFKLSDVEDVLLQRNKKSE